MASIEEALAKAAARSQKSSSKNRGLRPYDVVSRPVEEKLVSEESSVSLSKADFAIPVNIELSSRLNKDQSQVSEAPKPLVEEALSTSTWEPIQFKIEHNIEEIGLPTVEVKKEEKSEEAAPLGEEVFCNIAKQPEYVDRAPINVGRYIEAVDFEDLLEKTTEDAALKAFTENGGEKDIDEYMKEKGWNKVPHSLQKWALKTFRGNDLKGIYYFFYLAIRNESAVISIGYSAIAEALGVDKKVAPRRIIQNLVKKGAITVEVEPSYKTSRKYKLVPMELLLAQDPAFFKKGKNVELEITRNIDEDVPVLKKYLIKNFGDGEAFRVLPKYKFVLEKYSAAEVIELIEHTGLNGIWGIKPDKIGNINSLLTAGESPAQTFGKAFRSYKGSKGKTERIESLKDAEIESKLRSEQEEENIKFKVEQARQFLFALGKEEGERKLEELKSKYRFENEVPAYLPIQESMALTYFYDQMTKSKK